MNVRTSTSRFLGALLLLVMASTARAQSFSAVASGRGVIAVRQQFALSSARPHGFASVAQGSGVALLASELSTAHAARAQGFASVAQGSGVVIVKHARAATTTMAARAAARTADDFRAGQGRMLPDGQSALASKEDTTGREPR